MTSPGLCLGAEASGANPLVDSSELAGTDMPERNSKF